MKPTAMKIIFQHCLYRDALSSNIWSQMHYREDRGQKGEKKKRGIDKPHSQCGWLLLLRRAEYELRLNDQPVNCQSIQDLGPRDPATFVLINFDTIWK